MATRLATKNVNGRRVACVSTRSRSGERKEREYPQCRSKFAFFDALRTELALPKTTSMKEVARILESRTWGGKGWVVDSE